MTDRIETIIVEAFSSGMARENVRHVYAEDAPIVARWILSALKAARIAVVKLPEPCAPPSYWGEDCIGAWEAIGYGPDPVSAWPGQKQVALPDGMFITAIAARDLAAALLAAADAAEVSE